MGRRRGEDRRGRPPDRAREGHPRGHVLTPHRRAFLLSAAAAAACGRRPLPFDPEGQACDGDLPDGFLVRRVPFADELDLDRPIGEKYSEGLDARLIIDLSLLTPDTLVQAPEGFYLRTGAPTDLGDPAAWTVRVTGRVAQDLVLDLDALLAQVEPIGVVQFECSGNSDGAAFGLMSAGDFAGVPLAWVLDQVAPLPDATMVRVTGRDTHPESTFSDLGASWVYRIDELRAAWLVTHQDDEPIPLDHGHPVRLLMPGWYGCTNLKWVEEIAFVGDDEPATTQMQEFAARTHQDGVPALAKDYAPAEIECSATPVRVEEWEIDGERVFRVLGVVWGGKDLPDALHLWMDDEDLGPVELCAPRDVQTWGMWQTFLPANARGTVTLRLTAVGVPARRLDSRYYDRVVDLGR